MRSKIARPKLTTEILEKHITFLTNRRVNLTGNSWVETSQKLTAKGQIYLSMYRQLSNGTSKIKISRSTL